MTAPSTSSARRGRGPAGALGRRRRSRRTGAVTVGLSLVAVIFAAVSTTLGRYPLGIDRLVAVVLGSGSDFERLVVVDWRLPTAIAAILFGAALGLSGFLLQRLTRNPLGSPDLIGIDVGAFTGVAITVVFIGAKGFWEVSAAAVAGGLLTAVIVTVLAYRRGLNTFRLIVVGIAVAAALGSVNAFLITQADVGDAMSVGLWGAGSLDRVSWQSLLPSIVVVLAVTAGVLITLPAMRSLDLGDEIAIVHGVHVIRLRLALVGLAVVATATLTAVTGPLAFVALAAPHIARRLAPGTGPLPALAAGSAVLASAHLVTLLLAQTGVSAPVGLVTLALGGVYLLTLLIGGGRWR